MEKDFYQSEDLPSYLDHINPYIYPLIISIKVNCENEIRRLNSQT